MTGDTIALAATRKPLVLVVDDKSVNVRLVAALLSQSGYEVIFALSGREGVRLAREQLPDLVLLDMRMPDMDGFEVLQMLRDTPATSTIAVIFLTADDARETRVRAFDEGVDDLLTKPFIGRELLVRIRTHIELGQSRESVRRLEAECAELLVKLGDATRD